jgi:shikimate dehydrogenase
MVKYGLIGNRIGYSFSKTFFNSLFEREGRNDLYENFDIPDLNHFKNILYEN